MEPCVQVAPHSLALVLAQVCPEDKRDSASPPPAEPNFHHHSGYDVFASFKAVNMQHFWNQALTQALSEVFFLGWISERVLLIQGKELHLQVLRNGWTRRTLKPPQGFDIQTVGGSAGRCSRFCPAVWTGPSRLHTYARVLYTLFLFRYVRTLTHRGHFLPHTGSCLQGNQIIRLVLVRNLSFLLFFHSFR